MRYKKSQAAMEFLMTYGWAILVVLVAIGALAYFGVLSPDRFLPAKCQLPSGLACLDFIIDGGANTVTISLRNSIGFDLDNVQVAVGSCGTVAGTTLNNGEQKTFTTASCSPTLVPGAKYNRDVQVIYRNIDSGITHNVNGTMTGRVES